MPSQTIVSVLGLIKECRWKSVKAMLARIAAPDLKEILFYVGEHERGLIFRFLTRKKAAEVFTYLEPEEQDMVLDTLTAQETRQILAAMPPDDRTLLLSELPSEVTHRLFDLLSSDDLEEARMLLGYPEESVGRIMSPDYVRIKADWTVDHALQHIRFYGKNIEESLNMIYVVGDEGVLLFSVRLRTLILADPLDVVNQFIDFEGDISLSALADREQAVLLMQKYDIMALPVVDTENELVGIVTFDDIMDVAEEEATEDIHKSASVNPLKVGYHRAGAFDLYSKRVGWLLILVVLSILSSSVIAGFEDKLSKMTILFAFVPLLLGAGGNAGSQASTLVIRALVTGDIYLKDIVSTVIKEIGVGLLLGVTLGVTAAGISYYRAGGTPLIAVTVGVSMTLIIMVANLIGMLFPFVLSRLKIDPAVASAPLIATLTDVTGLIIYFSIAVFLIKL